MDKMNLLEYIQFLEKEDVNHKAIAQFNPETLATYEWLIDTDAFRYTEAGPSLYHPIFRMPDSNICFSRDEHGREENYNAPLGDVFSHNKVMPSFGKWLDTVATDMNYAKLVREAGGDNLDNICTTSLSLYGVDQTVNPDTLKVAGTHKMLWIESPVFALGEDFRNCLTLMGSKKRNAMDRILRKTDEAHNIAMEQVTILDGTFMNWALCHLNARFRYDDWGHALRSFLMAIAAVKTGTGDMFAFIDKDTRQLLAATYFVYDDETVVYQGIVRDMDNPISNIGPYTLAKCSEYYCAQGRFNYMDPTCETHVGEPDSVDSYKRKLINTEAWRPTIYINTTGVVDVPKPPIILLGTPFEGNEIHYYDPWAEDEE